jgi:hypothetical protein
MRTPGAEITTEELRCENHALTPRVVRAATAITPV